jgi:beta-glucosidase
MRPITHWYLLPALLAWWLRCEDAKNGGNGYLPVSLQYGKYTAETARETSLAGGDPLENFTNRSYKGKSETSTNVTDLAMVTDTYAKMKGKPVIVSVNLNNPMVFAELEKQANAIIADFGVQGQASLDILTGKGRTISFITIANAPGYENSRGSSTKMYRMI